MRPNIDMPWSLHGQVKEVADEEGLTVEEAYKRVVRRGLSTEDTAVQNIIQQIEENYLASVGESVNRRQRHPRRRRGRRLNRGGIR